MNLNYCRVRAFPFGPDVIDFIAHHERVLVVEQNRDAQLRSLLVLDGQVDQTKLIATLFYDGMPLDAKRVTDAVRSYLTGQGSDLRTSA
jgi:2-oxoglutarate ferredoxin oxidoreductase subunit alpha